LTPGPQSLVLLVSGTTFCEPQRGFGFVPELAVQVDRLVPETALARS
jgi:hypothetical protein